MLKKTIKNKGKPSLQPIFNIWKIDSHCYQYKKKDFSFFFKFSENKNKENDKLANI